MTFEEIFKDWTLEQKVEWTLGANICNLSENMRSIIVDLKNENERLKAELKQRTVHSDTNLNLWMRELKRGAEQEKEIEHLRKENAKLKCLALHAMSEYFGYKTLFSNKKKLRTKYGQFANKFYDAYRKAKQELMEGK